MARLFAIAALLGLSAVARADDPAASVRAACKGEGGLHRLVAPAPPLVWSDREGTLAVDLEQPFRFDGGNVVLWRQSDDDPGLAPVKMAVEQGAAIIKARERGQLNAVLAYELVASDLTAGPCLSLAGGRILKARYRPVRLELFEANDKSSAHAVAVFRSPGAAEAERAVPRVAIGPLQFTHRDERMRAAAEKDLAAIEPLLRRCYEDAVAKRADAGGHLVLNVEVDRGHLHVFRVELDALGDAALTKCARAIVEGGTVGPHIAGFSLPIAFERK
jgi:hypothetical protein